MLLFFSNFLYNELFCFCSGSRVQQQQEVSINLGKENEEDNETEKAQTIETSSLAKGSTGSLTQVHLLYKLTAVCQTE